MKKKFRNVQTHKWFLVLFVVLHASLSSASVDLDRQYSLETIGVLKTWDNIDGLFEEYVQEATKDYFAVQSRFRLQDLSKINELLADSSIKYNKIIQDKEILKKAAKTARVETLLRTRIYKEGPRYKMIMDWLHAQQMDMLATHTFYYDEPKPGSSVGPVGKDSLREVIQEALDHLIEKVPFKGNVTGRDQEWVTINMGSGVGKKSALKDGVLLQIATLEGVKRHPLLGEIVEWNWAPTGQVIVDHVDEKLAFAKVRDEVEGQKISRYQKVIKILPPPPPEEQELQPGVRADGSLPSGVYSATEAVAQGNPNEKPKLGWMTISGGVGSFSRSYSSSSASKSGSGLLFGFEARTELWLTQKFFADLALGFGFAGYSQTDVTSGSSSGASVDIGTASLSRFEGAIGYNYYLNNDFWGPRLFARMGYRKNTHSLVESSSELVGPVSFSSLFIGVGSDLPMGSDKGLLVSLDFGLLPSATESGFTSGASTGATDVGVYIGGYYILNPKMRVRAGFEIMGNSMDFSGGNLSHRTIAFVPALAIYF